MTFIVRQQHKVKGRKEVKGFYNRRSNKKSRNGCGTCKIRKVKCDETKPVCERCREAGIKCDGYLDIPPKRRGPKPQSRPSQRPIVAASSPGHAIPSLQFENPIEAIYFSHFRTVVVSELSGSFDTGFWSRLVLASSHSEPFILKTIIAISALRTSQTLSYRSPKESSDHGEFALREYQKAIQMMTTSLCREASPRKALLMCLLVCCFEGLSGNTYTALSHARSGQKLLEEWLDSHPYSRADEEYIASPASHEIEDDLVQASGFFEQQICGLFDIRESAVFARRKRLGERTVQNMPERFERLKEARAYWTLIHRRCMNFIMDTVRNLPKPEEHSDEKPPDAPPPEISMHIYAFLQERARYAADVVRWRAAFSDIYEEIKSSRNSRLIIAAHTLYLQARMQDLVMAGMMEAKKKFTPEWTELLDLSRTVIHHHKSLQGSQTRDSSAETKYLFELGILPVLHMVAKYCDEIPFRKEAIRLMRWYAAREGNWDAETLADVDEAFLELQMEGSGEVERDLGVRAKGRLIRVGRMRGKRVDERYAGYVAGVPADADGGGKGKGKGKGKGDEKEGGERREVKLNWIETREWPGHVPRMFERSVGYEERGVLLR